MRALLAIAAVSLAVAGCGADPAPSSIWSEPELSITPPPNFPAQRVSPSDPWSVDKARLGRWLFYDRRLSGNETTSCGSCHRQSLAFTDGRATALGSTGERHFRASMSLANVGYASALNWASTLHRELPRQALVPMFGESPVELGLAGRESEMLERLRAEALYRDLFPRAFPGPVDPFTVDNVTRALGAFQRALISANSPYDRYQRGDASAMSASAVRGMNLFFSETTECFHCHGGFNLTDSVVHARSAFDETAFHNTGLYNVDGRGAYPESDTGLHAQTGVAEDMGRFRAPTLRNIAVTAPYMHDGSIATLDEVISHYSAGGRTISSGPNAGVGSANPFKSGFVRGFALTNEERADLIAFLEALTDPVFLTDPRYADPFGRER